MTVRQGEFLAITGSSGCGKSSIINGILGFAEILAGKIYINGKDITDDIPARREIFRVCFQNPYLFSQTLEYNLNYNFSQENHAEVWKEAGIDTLVKNKGKNYMLDSKTQSLSGGEKRRIAFARTLNRNVPIYIFDEPTAELDKENRGCIINAIKSMRGKATLVVISHDQELINEADRVYCVGNE